MSDAIKEYWERRAAEGSDGAVTTNDVHLRELEHTALVQTLREVTDTEGARLLDVGCGDGLTTLRVAKKLPGLRVLGIDYSENMIALARVGLEREEDAGLAKQIEFVEGDVTNLRAATGGKRFDVVVTDRCLINLDSADKQYDALRQIAECLNPGSYYVGIENFMEGQERMNDARAAVGLREIPVRWHNLFLQTKNNLKSACSLPGQ